MDEGLLNRLHDIAATHDVSLSHVIRRAGREFLNGFIKPLPEALRESGMSQKELAAKACISPQTMSRIVRGETRPRRDTARLIARALGHPVTTLFPILHSLN